MARKKLKMTPFARFIIVMLFVAPLAFLAASYYNGENGMEKIKGWLGMEQREEPAEAPVYVPDPEVRSDLEIKLQDLQDQYSELSQENLELKKTLREQELEIQELKRQLREQQQPAAEQ